MKRILFKVLPIAALVAILVTLPILAEERGNGDDALPDGIDILNEILDSMASLRFDDEAAELLHILEQLMQIREEDRLTLNQYEVRLLLPTPRIENDVMLERILESIEQRAASGPPASRAERLEYFKAAIGLSDYREALFADFLQLVQIATSILDFSRGREVQPGIFTSFSIPSWGGGWDIGIVDEAYLPVIRHLINFVGIPPNSIDVRIDTGTISIDVPIYRIGHISDDGVMRFFCPDVLAYLSQYSHLHISEDGVVTHLKDAADGSLDVFD